MLENLKTEIQNEATMNLDQMSALEILTVMNQEDAKVPQAISEALPNIASVAERIAACFKKGGRLIYSGAGTSGRLGILDAVECVPTFGVPETMVVGLIAGGDKAMVRAVEGAEDSEELGRRELEEINFSKDDFLVGIAASGRTPYVIGALEYAKELGADNCAIACNKGSEIGKVANSSIEVEVGSEVLTGSTRLKSGTAQKLILNMLSTSSMVLIGKVYKNLMVDVLATNKKLEDRMVRIVKAATGAETEEAAQALEQSGNKAKVAIVMVSNKCSCEEATSRLDKAEGFVGKAIALNM